MKNLNEKIKEKEEIYEKKIEQLEQMQKNFNTVKVEAINLEGQIASLKELKAEQSNEEE